MFPKPTPDLRYTCSPPPSQSYWCLVTFSQFMVMPYMLWVVRAVVVEEEEEDYYRAFFVFTEH